MPLYQNSIIYKLFKQDDYDNDNIYIGSTTNFRGRKGQHKNHCNNSPNSKIYNSSLYQYIRNNGGFENWCMIQIESFPCNSKKDLETRERYWIDTLKPKLNISIPTRTKKEWYNDNKEKKSENAKIYYNDNKEKILEKSTKWYNDNKEKKKEYKENNKEIILKNRKENIICECGCSIRKVHISTHIKTLKHQKLMENI